MENLRKTPRVETQHIITTRYTDQQGTSHKIRAMLLNISLDGAMIETAEALSCQTLLLSNQYKNETHSIQANVIHHMDVPQDERVFGMFRSGLIFSDASNAAKEFIISIIKFQNDELKKRSDTPSSWMDTAQISQTLFSPDADEDDIELTDALDSVAVALDTSPLTDFKKPIIPTANVKQRVTSFHGAPPLRPSGPSFKETVEKTLNEPSPKAPSQARLPFWPMVTTLCAVVLLLGSLFIFRMPAPESQRDLTFTERIGLDLPFIGERPIILNLPSDGAPLNDMTPLPARLLKETIQGSVVFNKTLGNLFVIRGVIHLEQGHRLEEITVRGKMFSDKNDLVATLSTWPGNILDDNLISSLDNSGLSTVRNYTPDKGYRAEVPFVLIFSQIPKNTRSFSVDLSFQTF